MIRRPPRSTLFPYTSSSDLRMPIAILGGPRIEIGRRNALSEAVRLSVCRPPWLIRDRKSTRLNSSHLVISYAVFCLKKKKTDLDDRRYDRRLRARVDPDLVL